MSSQFVLVTAIIAGILGLSFGVFIIYIKFNRTKSYLEVQVQRAEKELELDLQDISEIELLKTQPGRELNLILSQEKKRSNVKLRAIDNLIIEGIIQKTRIVVFWRVVSMIVLYPIKVLLEVMLARLMSIFNTLEDLDPSSAKEAKK